MVAKTGLRQRKIMTGGKSGDQILILPGRAETASKIFDRHAVAAAGPITYLVIPDQSPGCCATRAPAQDMRMPGLLIRIMRERPCRVVTSAW